MAESTYVTETNAENFQADVLDRSHKVPVVLDFWAAWCQPCRMLAPLLEKEIEQHQGQVQLVKADVDQLPHQAAAFGVQGIPAVYAVRDGQIVDAFTGLLTEVQLHEWVQRILPTEADKLLKQARQLEPSDPAAAEACYRQAIMLAPRSTPAKLGLARVLLALGADEACREVLKELGDPEFLEPEAHKLLAELELRSHQMSSADLSQLEQRLAASPDDLKLKLELAEAQIAAGNYSAGLQQALEVVERGSGPQREPARVLMVNTFRVLGEESDETKSFRRRLTLALY